MKTIENVKFELRNADTGELITSSKSVDRLIFISKKQAKLSWQEQDLGFNHIISMVYEIKVPNSDCGKTIFRTTQVKDDIIYLSFADETFEICAIKQKEAKS